MTSPFSQIELDNIHTKLGVMTNSLNVSESIINTEEEFNDLYSKSRGCISEDSWVLFFTEHTADKTRGSLHKLSQEAVLALSKKYKVELK